MAVESSHVFQRPIYAGNAIITVQAPADQTVVATIRTASWPAVAAGGNAPVEALAVEATLPTHTRYQGLQAGSSDRSEEHTSELQSLMRISYAVFCLKKKNNNRT